MLRRGVPSPETRWKDGQSWLMGTDADVAWIQGGTPGGLAITSAIPPLFDAYATIVVPSEAEARSAEMRFLLDVLAEHSGSQSWWLGYLDTGTDDIVFQDAPRVTLYAGWKYVLVQAGKEQAERWRSDSRSWRAPGPDIVFPADRSWLLSWLWDDDWRCLGGSTELIDRLLGDGQLEARPVSLTEDATPPGHVAY